MVLDTPTLEDAAGVRDGVTFRLVGLVLLAIALIGLPAACTSTVERTDLATSASGASDGMADLVAPYIRARDDQVVGEVVGRAYRDPKRPSAPPVPLEGVSAVMLPYSPAVESELDGIKEHLRDSLKHYMGAAAEIESIRTAYESDLVWVGGGELIRGEVSNAQGLVRLTNVPAGEWVLLAWREESRPGKAPKLRAQETRGFRDIPVSVGHSIVTYWWTRLRVSAGEITSVEFNDRNVWVEAVQEQLQMIQGSGNAATRRRR